MGTNKMRDISREEFENSPKFRGMDFTRAPEAPDYYLSPYANGAWDGWQASREAVVVELPPKISAHNTSEGGFVRPEAEHYDEAIDDCRAAIEAQGLKVAP